MANPIRLTRLSAGRYQIGDYIIDHTPDGWRWHLSSNASTGGEWRATMRDAKLDLHDHMIQVSR